MDERLMLADDATDPAALPAPAFDLWIEPGDASTEDIYEVLSALSDLNRACGGDGFTYETPNPRSDG